MIAAQRSIAPGVYRLRALFISSLIRYIFYLHRKVNPLSANPEKWSNTLKQIVGNLPTICLSVFDHFVNLALKGLRKVQYRSMTGYV